MKSEFRIWLIEKLEQSESTANSRVANIRTVERHYGDLDELFQKGKAQNLLDDLSYSKEDERNGLPQKHMIPTHGNIYNVSATWKQAVKKYIEFYRACVNPKDVMSNNETLLSQTMDESVNGEFEPVSEYHQDSTFDILVDILGVSRLESVHTNFLKWLLEKGRGYSSILEYFVKSIVKKANNRELELEGLKPGFETLLSAENNAVQLNKKRSEYTCHYREGRYKKTASADLVVNVMVNNSPLTIIIENKVWCKELNNQTKIYHAYFSGNGSEIEKLNKSVYKKNPNYKRGNHKGEPKILRYYKRKDNESQLFVFLTPVDYDYGEKAKDLSEYFIKYTYQDLLDDVIFPSLEDEVFSREEKVFLADYVGMLIKADRDNKVMAKESEESRRLMQFKAAFETFSFAKSQKDTVSDKTQSEAFGQVANGAYELLDKIDADDQIRKVKRRVPGWKNRPHQINSKILAIFMELSGNGKNGVSLDMLQDEFETRYPEERGIFTKNYNQMRNNGYKNHGKVFYEDNEQTVWLWGPIRDFVIEVYSK